MPRKSQNAVIPQGLLVVLSSTMLLFIMATSADAQSLLTHHVPEVVSSGRAQFLHWMPSTQILRLNVVLPLRDEAGLKKFLQQVYNPSSSSYRHFLIVPEFTARFGPTEENYDSLVKYLISNGFNVVGGS